MHIKLNSKSFNQPKKLVLASPNKTIEYVLTPEELAEYNEYVKLFNETTEEDIINMYEKEITEE